MGKVLPSVLGPHEDRYKVETAPGTCFWSPFISCSWLPFPWKLGLSWHSSLGHCGQLGHLMMPDLIRQPGFGCVYMCICVSVCLACLCDHECVFIFLPTCASCISLCMCKCVCVNVSVCLFPDCITFKLCVFGLATF